MKDAEDNVVETLARREVRAIADNSGASVAIAPQARKSQFLALYAENGSIGAALKAIGANYSEYRRWQADEQFQDEFLHAATLWLGKVEAEIARRAIDGVEEPVVSMGRLVATKRVYSDALLKVAARAADPKKYGDGRKVFGSEVGVKADGTKYFKAYAGFDPEEDV